MVRLRLDITKDLGFLCVDPDWKQQEQRQNDSIDDNETEVGGIWIPDMSCPKGQFVDVFGFGSSSSSSSGGSANNFSGAVFYKINKQKIYTLLQLAQSIVNAKETYKESQKEDDKYLKITLCFP